MPDLSREPVREKEDEVEVVARAIAKARLGKKWALAYTATLGDEARAAIEAVHRWESQ